jgi:hypothetical protein
LEKNIIKIGKLQKDIVEKNLNCKNAGENK